MGAPQDSGTVVDLGARNAGAGIAKPRLGGHDHAVAREPRTHAEVEAIVVDRKRGIEAVEALPDVAAHEHADGPNAQNVFVVVVLLLVELVAVEHPAAARPGEPLAQLNNA